MITLEKFINKTAIRCHAVSGKPYFNIIFDFESLVTMKYQGKFYNYLEQIRAYKMKEIIDPSKTLNIEEIVYDKLVNKNAKYLNVELKRYEDINIKHEASSIAKIILTNLYNHIITNLNMYPAYDESVTIEMGDD